MPTDPRETLRRHHDETQAALDKARAEAAHQAPAAELSAAWDELAQCTLASEGLSEAPSDRPRFHLAFALRLMRVANLLNVQGRLADLTRLEGKEIAIDHAINLMYYAASGVTVEELAARMQETAEEPYFIDRVGNLLRRGLRDMLGKIAAPTNVAEPASPAAPSVTASPTEPAGATKNTPLELFYSYSHKDVKLRGRLETHLSLLKREGWIVGWHDRKIGAGNEWKGQIDQHLNSAGIILLLVSADFIASDYCYDVEMKRAMERHKAGDARVIPIILKPCDWHSAPFGELQALPNEGRAVTKWKPQDEAFTDIARGLRAAVKEMTGRS